MKIFFFQLYPGNYAIESSRRLNYGVKLFSLAKVRCSSLHADIHFSVLKAVFFLPCAWTKQKKKRGETLEHTFKNRALRIWILISLKANEGEREKQFSHSLFRAPSRRRKSGLKRYWESFFSSLSLFSDHGTAAQTLKLLGWETFYLKERLILRWMFALSWILAPMHILFL